MGILGETMQPASQEQTEENVQETQTTGNETTETTESSQTGDTNTQTEEVGSFSFDAFNKHFEREFKDEDEIKSVFEKAGKYDDVLSDLESKDTKIGELEQLTGKLNPREWFASDDEFVKNQFLRTKKDELGETKINALKGVSPSSIENMSAQDALKLDLIVNKGLDSEEAGALIEQKYGDLDEDDKGALAGMKVEALSAKDGLKKLYEGIDIPEAVDYEAQKIALKDSWNTPLSEATKSLSEIKVSEDFTFNADASELESVKQEVYDELLQAGVKPSEESLGFAMSRISDKIVLNNMDKILKARDADLKEVWKEEYRKEIHNDTSLNTSSRETGTQESNASKLLKYY